MTGRAPCLNRALSATVMRGLKARFAEAAERLAEGACAKGAVRRRRRMRRSLSDDGAAGRGRTVERRPRASLALCRDGVQHVRPRQRAETRRGRADGAACAWISGAMPAQIAVSNDGIGAMIHAAADAGEVTRQEAALLVRSLLTPASTRRCTGSAPPCTPGRRTPTSSAPCGPIRSRRAPRSRRRSASDPPVQTFFRTTTRDVSLSGVGDPPRARRC